MTACGPSWIDFTQKLILLFVTAAISGFLVPYFLKIVDAQKAEREKLRDAQLARQEKIIQAEVEFLERLTEKLWAWRYLAIRLTYYGAYGPPEQYEKSKSVYSEQFWTSLNALRVEFSRSQRIVSSEIVSRLGDFYAEMIKIDLDLQRAVQEQMQSTREAMYADLNSEIFHRVSGSIDELLTATAADLRLSSNH